MAFTGANHIFYRASAIKQDGMLEKSIYTEFIEDIRATGLQDNLRLCMRFAYEMRQLRAATLSFSFHNIPGLQLNILHHTDFTHLKMKGCLKMNSVTCHSSFNMIVL